MPDRQSCSSTEDVNVTKVRDRASSEKFVKSLMNPASLVQTQSSISTAATQSSHHYTIHDPTQLSSLVGNGGPSTTYNNTMPAPIKPRRFVREQAAAVAQVRNGFQLLFFTL
jgi:hypothetical protein